jgi:DNA-binding GntR family transcriptional regulator
MMNVSRASVREAMRRLEAEKLITIVPNKGPSVAIISWEEAKQIYHVRALLEGEAAALFAPLATAGDKRRMRQILKAFIKSGEHDSVGRRDAIKRFYEVILVGCGNQIIHELMDGLVARINFVRFGMSYPGRLHQSAGELQRILAAIERGDARAARAAAISHVQASCNVAGKVFASRNAAAADLLFERKQKRRPVRAGDRITKA